MTTTDCLLVSYLTLVDKLLQEIETEWPCESVGIQETGDRPKFKNLSCLSQRLWKFLQVKEITSQWPFWAWDPEVSCRVSRGSCAKSSLMGVMAKTWWPGGAGITVLSWFPSPHVHMGGSLGAYSCRSREPRAPALWISLSWGAVGTKILACGNIVQTHLGSTCMAARRATAL